MKTTLINKLVRDKILSSMESEGATVEKRTLDQSEYIQALKNKLVEEAKEVQTALTQEEQIEELADLFEVVFCLMASLEIDPILVENKRITKNEAKGSFKDKIFIISKTL